MWFTIAFLTYPIALYLVYKAIKDYKINGVRNTIIAIIIFIFPITLLLIERSNLSEIEKDLIGMYVSETDTLTLNNKDYLLKSNLNNTIGLWEFIVHDKLYVRLIDSQNIKTELEITFKDEEPKLTNEKKTYEKIKCEKEARTHNSNYPKGWVSCSADSHDS